MISLFAFHEQRRGRMVECESVWSDLKKPRSKDFWEEIFAFDGMPSNALKILKWIGFNSSWMRWNCALKKQGYFELCLQILLIDEKLKNAQL